MLASHPIQYQAPLFRALAARPEIQLHVFFCRRWGIDPYQDPGFQITLSWDTPLLEGYPYTFLPNWSPFPSSSGFFGTINPGILSALRPGSFDAVLIHDWALASDWLGWAAAAFRRLPILLRGETNGLAEPTGLRRWIKRFILKILFCRVEGFLAIGTHNANFYRSCGVPENRIFWTPYAVDNSFFLKQAGPLNGPKALLRAKKGLPPDPPVILFCGKLIEKKRPFDLLKAFSLLDGNPKSSLAFVGEGPLRIPMKRFVAEKGLANVFFLGFCNQSELPPCYAMADALVLPSGEEPWGLVLNEAMCFGLPIIASDRVGAAADLVREGLNGFVYPVGDVTALAEGLRKTLRDPDVGQAMGSRSKEMIQRWGLEETVEGIVQCLNARIGHKM